MELPETYILEKLYQYGHKVTHNKYSDVYYLCCSICHEGKSWGKKKRLYYIPKNNTFFCHNCGYSAKPVDWIMKASGMSYSEVMAEIREKNIYAPILKEEKKLIKVETLPEDSINLFDKQQTSFYLNNQVVKDALLFIKKRRLDTAINRPKALYISLKDYIHKNRLCIPFYDDKNKILFYQTRAIYKEDEVDRPKYLSKLNSDKTIFGLNNVDNNFDYLFIFEGPIDACFVKNGVAMGGTSMSNAQQNQLKKYTFFNKIWVLDNEVSTNEVVKEKINQLVETGERIFVWPAKFKDFKDINDICMKYGIDKISTTFFIENSFEGSIALSKV